MSNSRIAAGAITTDKILPRSVTAEKVDVYDLQAKVVRTAELDAGNITTGVLSADRLAAGSITSAKLNVGDIQANVVKTATIDAGQIKTGTLDAALVTADTLRGKTLRIGDDTYISVSEWSDNTIGARMYNQSRLTGAMLVDETTNNVWFELYNQAGARQVHVNSNGQLIARSEDGLVERDLTRYSRVHMYSTSRPINLTYPALGRWYARASYYEIQPVSDTVTVNYTVGGYVSGTREQATQVFRCQLFIYTETNWNRYVRNVLGTSAVNFHYINTSVLHGSHGWCGIDLTNNTIDRTYPGRTVSEVVPVTPGERYYALPAFYTLRTPYGNQVSDGSAPAIINFSHSMSWKDV